MSDLVERLRRPVFDSEEWYSALGAAFKMRDAGHRDSCARDLMDSYVDEAATERTEAADEIERLQGEAARLTDERERGTAALRTAFGPELWQLGHPAYVVVHLREEIEKVTRLWKAATVERDALLARVEAAEKDLMDGAMLIRRLARALTAADNKSLAPRNAMNWLSRKPWFKASPLRDDTAMEGGKC